MSDEEHPDWYIQAGTRYARIPQVNRRTLGEVNSDRQLIDKLLRLAKAESEKSRYIGPIGDCEGSYDADVARREAFGEVVKYLEDGISQYDRLSKELPMRDSY